jgi:hypothetical protein
MPILSARTEGRRPAIVEHDPPHRVFAPEVEEQKRLVLPLHERRKGCAEIPLQVELQDERVGPPFRRRPKTFRFSFAILIETALVAHVESIGQQVACDAIGASGGDIYAAVKGRARPRQSGATSTI